MYGTEAEIFNSATLLAGTQIYGSTKVAHATVCHSPLNCDLIATTGTISNCVLLPGVQVADAASLEYVTALGDVKIYGTARIIGTPETQITLSGRMDIQHGVWHRAPQTCLLEDDGVSVSLTECAARRVHLGCLCRPIAYWRRAIAKGSHARAYGWKPELVTQFSDFLTHLEASTESE